MRVPTQKRKPATAAPMSVVPARVSPYIPGPFPGTAAPNPAAAGARRNAPEYSSAVNSSTVCRASSEKKCSTTPTCRSLWNGTSRCATETRFTGQPRARGAAHGDADRGPLAGRDKRERRREPRPRPLLRVAVEASTATPPPRSAARPGRRARRPTSSTRAVMTLTKSRSRGRAAPSRARRGRRGRRARRRTRRRT